jgi:hypothetical protein
MYVLVCHEKLAFSHEEGILDSGCALVVQHWSTVVLNCKAGHVAIAT